MDDSQADSALTQARAARKFAEAHLAQAQNNLKQQPVRIAQQRASVEAVGHRVSAAQRILQRKRELFQKTLVSSLEVALAEEQLRELAALSRADTERLRELELSDPSLAVREARAKVEEARAAVQQAEHAWEQCVLKAPEAGRVLRIQVGVGETVGGPNGKPGIVFCPARPFLVRAEVEQEFIGRVAIGQAAQVEDEVNSSACRRGQVTRVANWYSLRRSVFAQPGELKDIPTVECIISLEEGAPVFRLGQRVKVKIRGKYEIPE
jgi:multidrug resistance efflux pump